MPKYAFLFLLFTLANVGLPGTSGFIGEFLVLVGIFKINIWVAVFATTGVVLSAAYALSLYRRVIFGDLIKLELKEILDLNKREVLILLPLAIAIITFGIYPEPLLSVMHSSVENLIYQNSLALDLTINQNFAGNR
tara:strand:- start:328 stop:735 length:408 start_codon:yes stop_codon:yes gene_type:complete